jgi:hypothetical protein
LAINKANQNKNKIKKIKFIKDMKKIKSILSIALIIMAGFIVSCSKDNSGTKPVETDARDLALGTYTGLSSLKDTSGVSISDTTVTFIVTKGSGKSLIITENEGGKFSTGDILVSGKNISGNIPVQTINTDGLSVSLKGRGNNNEQFGFMESTKVISYNIEFTDGPLKGYTYDVFGTKK